MIKECPRCDTAILSNDGKCEVCEPPEVDLSSEEIRFYWFQESTEIYAARSVEEFHDHVAYQLYGDERVPSFTQENKGELWGEISSDEIVHDEETGAAMKLGDALKHWKIPVPCQVSTSYN
jgi:hypothetical protein